MAGTAKSAARRVIRCVTFYLGDDVFAVEVERAQEVLTDQALTRVPLANRGIRGLLNLRGQVVTVFDLRHIFAYDDYPEGGDLTHVVVNTGEATVSLLVDREGEYVEVEATALQPTPPTLSADLSRRLQGVCELDDGRLMLLLDVDAALDF